MSRASIPLFFVFLAGGWALLPPSSSTGQTTAKIQPKLDPVAETRLLMEGLAHANFRGIESLLEKKPTETKTWMFARGQALLIAETANLLMLRPPKNEGQPVWFERAMELRSSAQDLAKHAAAQEYELSRSGLVQLAKSCNHCHQTFRVPVEITAFAAKTDNQ